MDIVFIEGLEVKALIGVHDHERIAPQPLYLDLEMAAPVGQAAASDSIDDALDYGAVAAALAELSEQSRCRLIETLAEACAGMVMERFGVPWVRVRLRKPGALADARAAGVVIERGRR